MKETRILIEGQVVRVGTDQKNRPFAEILITDDFRTNVVRIKTKTMHKVEDVLKITNAGLNIFNGTFYGFIEK